MKGTLIVVKTDGSITVEKLDTAPNFRKLQRAVNGPIEVVPRFNVYNGQECVAFCHEEGKIKKLAFNRAAQLLWAQCVNNRAIADRLVGDIAIITGDKELLSHV